MFSSAFANATIHTTRHRDPGSRQQIVQSRACNKWAVVVVVVVLLLRLGMVFKKLSVTRHPPRPNAQIYKHHNFTDIYPATCIVCVCVFVCSGRNTQPIGFG